MVNTLGQPFVVNTPSGPVTSLDQAGNAVFGGDVTISTITAPQIPQKGTVTLYTTDGVTVSTMSTAGSVNQMATLSQVGTTPQKDLGVLDWTEDPRLWQASDSNDAGVVWLTRYIPGYTFLWSSVWIGIASQPTLGWTSGQNFIGVYNNAGVLISETADLSTQFATSKIQACTFTGPVTATAGSEYFIGLLLNYTGTAGSLKSTGGGTSSNGPLVAPHLRISTVGSGLTALPNTITLSTQSTTLVASGKGSQGYLMD